MIGVFRRISDALTFRIDRRILSPIAHRIATIKNRTQKPIRKIGIIATVSGFGNAILLEPTLRKLREIFPIAEIFLVGPKPYFEIFSPTKLIDHLTIADPYEAKFFRELIKNWKIAKIDTVIEAYAFRSHGRQKFQISLNFPRFFTTRSSQLNKMFTGIHEIDENFSVLPNSIEISDDDRFPKLHLTESEQISAKQILDRFFLDDRRIVGVHLGSGENQKWKRWDAVNFAEICDRIRKKWNAEIAIFGGPEERDLIKPLKKKLGECAKDLIGLANFRTTAAVIAECDLFIACDTGLMNVANAVGVPLIALFGPTQIEKTAPIGSADRIFIVSLNLDCQPCYLTIPNFPMACPHFDCLKTLTADLFWEKSESFIDRWLTAEKGHGSADRELGE